MYGVQIFAATTQVDTVERACALLPRDVTVERALTKDERFTRFTLHGPSAALGEQVNTAIRTVAPAVQFNTLQAIDERMGTLAELPLTITDA